MNKSGRKSSDSSFSGTMMNPKSGRFVEIFENKFMPLLESSRSKKNLWSRKGRNGLDYFETAIKAGLFVRLLLAEQWY